MPKPTRDKPDDSLKAHFITKDGFLWWNPDFKKYHKRRDYNNPIGVRRNSKYPTVSVDGEMYHIHRLNWWLHKDTWPAMLDVKDDSKTALHIDNLFESNASKVRANGPHKDAYDYVIKTRKTRKGVERFIPSIVFGGKRRYFRTYKTREEAIEAALTVRWLLLRDGKFPVLLKSLVK